MVGPTQIINGSHIPDVPLARITHDGFEVLSASDVFGDGKSVVIGIPGAFTPTCTKKHIPDFIRNAGQLSASGYERLFCVVANDPFVVDRWRKEVDPNDTLTFLSDGNLEFCKALGLTLENRESFLGARSKRYLLILQNGQIVRARAESDTLDYTCTRSSDVDDS